MRHTISSDLKVCFDSFKSILFRVKSAPFYSCFYYVSAAGLGEMMPLQLWETTLDPTQRMLKQLTLEDAAEASMMFSVLMGDKVSIISHTILFSMVPLQQWYYSPVLM